MSADHQSTPWAAVAKIGSDHHDSHCLGPTFSDIRSITDFGSVQALFSVRY